ncbi:hypothetical protein OC845_004842 [Tilletia horrida]|nr:hypothetical protein OC845_004842 [Tilletia horrida]
MLWNQKVIHEDSVKPLICDIDAVQERLFHVRTLFSFFILFMHDKPIITSWSGLLGPAANNTRGADSSQGGGGKRQKRDSNGVETGSSGHDWSGTGGGSTEGGLADQSIGSNHSDPSSSAETTISLTSSTAAKNEAKILSEPSLHSSPGVAQPSLKRMRTEDGLTRSESPYKERQTSPTLPSDELDAFSDSDSDSYEFSEDEEENQARRERRRERLRLNIMALNFMMRNHGMA